MQRRLEPGFQVFDQGRSLFAPDGQPLAKVMNFVNGHNSDLRERWGGWYVTGTTAGDTHLGNRLAIDPNHPEAGDATQGVNVTRLDQYLDTARYLAPHSDVVALLVLEHQARMLNLLTRANYEARYARDWPTDKPGGGDADWRRKRLELAGESLLEYLLFRNEAPLHGRVTGTSGFAEEFQQRGPRDAKGRSLREFELATRLFRYPCSYLIYSPAFDALPVAMKNFLWGRLADILSGKDQRQTYASLQVRDRDAVREILQDTKPEFAAWLGKR